MRCYLAFLPVVLCGQLLFAAGPGGGTAKPPAPYTPIKATSSQFRCLGRKTELGALLLPQQIYAAGQPLLASPVRIVMEPDLLAGAKGKSKVTDRAADEATWEWSGESAAFRVSVRMIGDCDGFCWYDLQLTPKAPASPTSRPRRPTRKRLGSTARASMRRCAGSA